jgi:hypothetical protein
MLKTLDTGVSVEGGENAIGVSGWRRERGGGGQTTQKDPQTLVFLIGL